MSTDGDVVREALNLPTTSGQMPSVEDVKAARLGLARLEARIEEQDEKLRQAEITDRALTDYFADASRRAEAAEARCERYEKALRWIEEFSAKMPRAGVDGGHTGFVHIERRARAALAEEPYADVSDETFRMTPGQNKTIARAAERERPR